MWDMPALNIKSGSNKVSQATLAYQRRRPPIPTYSSIFPAVEVGLPSLALDLLHEHVEREGSHAKG